MRSREGDSEASEEARSIRRRVNLDIAAIARGLDDADAAVFEFFCECGQNGCRAVVRMTLAQLDERREIGQVLARHHMDPRSMH